MQVVRIFQKNKFQAIHILQLNISSGEKGGPVPMQGESPQLQDTDPTHCHGLGMYLCVPIVPIRYEYLSNRELFDNMNNHNSSNNT